MSDRPPQGYWAWREKSGEWRVKTPGGGCTAASYPSREGAQQEADYFNETTPVVDTNER